MKKTHLILLVCTLFFISCAEWEPVFTHSYKAPNINIDTTYTANTTIAALKAMYKGQATPITEDIIIKGQVTTSDEAGNFYKSLYIQDATAAIEVKIGRPGLYNDYKEGQWLYIKCNGLCLGAYEGTLQLGYKSTNPNYQTSYMDSPYIINSHVFKGKIDTLVTPVIIADATLQTLNNNVGKLVTLEGLKYGKQIFCIVYLDPKKDTKSNSNRFFLSKQTYGVTTWAMSKNGFINYLNMGNFNNVPLASERDKTMLSCKDTLIKNAQANAVSQYFKLGSTPIQVRTSGYARFADTAINADVISGKKQVNLTGILTKYRADFQFLLIDDNGCKVVD